MVELVFAWGFIIGAVISIVVISNPASTSAIFISLTEGMKNKERINTAKRSIKYSTGILIFFSVTGLLLFQIFGFSIGAFRIAGGILLFTTAVSMLNPTPAHKEAEATSKDIALIPLSIPFTAGPGTIVTIVILMSEAENILFNDSFMVGILCIFGVYMGIAANLGISFLMMKNSKRIDARLKEGGRNVMTKIMGLIVMAIAIQFILNGIKDEVPAFMEIINNNQEIIWLTIQNILP